MIGDRRTIYPFKLRFVGTKKVNKKKRSNDPERSLRASFVDKKKKGKVRSNGNLLPSFSVRLERGEPLICGLRYDACDKRKERISS